MNVYAILTFTILLTSCFNSATQGIGSTERKGSTKTLQSVASKIAADGITSAAIDPTSKQTQLVAVPSGSTVTGSSLQVPPGALSIAANILIEEATPLATPTSLAELSISSQAVRQGRSVSIQASELVDAKVPLTISIPLPAGFGLSSDSYPNLVILYRVARNDQLSNVSGIIPRDQITVANGYAQTQTLYFGAFQVVVMSEPLAAKEVKVDTPAYTISTVQVRPKLVITSASEAVAQYGHHITINGINFRQNMILALGNTRVGNMRVESDVKASFDVLAGNGAGSMNLSGEQDGVLASVPMFFLPAAEDLPLITMLPTEVCGGTRYYDRTGAIQLGTKICSADVAGLASGDLRTGVKVGSVTGVLPVYSVCTTDGQAGCVVVGPTITSVATSGLAAKVLTGQTVAGINGTGTTGAPPNCAADGATGCVAVTNFPAVDKVTNITGNASKIRSTVTIAGVTGTLADCSTDGGAGCVVVGPTYSAAITTGAAAKIVSGQTVAGVSGSATPAPANCAADGATGCVAVTNFPTVDKVTNIIGNASKIRSTVTIAGVTGTLADCSADGGAGCVVVGPTYAAATTTGAGAKIITGQTVAGVSGYATPAPANCAADGAMGCVAVTNFPAVDKVTNLAAGNLAKIHSTVTVGGVVGTMASCSADGGLSCMTAAGFPAADTTGSAAKILTGQTLAGVSGTATPAPANCAADGATGCVAVTNFPAVVKANVTAGLIKNGTVIAGVTGAYPSATYLLAGATATADLTAAAFNAQVKSSITFEYFSPDGVLQNGAGNSNITSSNIQSGVSIFSTTGTFGASCTGDAQTNCLTTTTYKSADTTSYTSWDIRTGKTIAGVAGSLGFNKNTANLSVYNRITGTSANISTSAADFYDTITDGNNGGATLPPTAPTGFLSAVSGNWVRDPTSDTGLGGGVASNAICDGTEDCVYSDRITNLYWAKSDNTSRTWEVAITYCENLTFGSYTDWRLPTQKEFAMASIDGIMLLKTPLNLLGAQFWTATTVGALTTNAIAIDPGNLITYDSIIKTSNSYPTCVRP